MFSLLAYDYIIAACHWLRLVKNGDHAPPGAKSKEK
jgi:hypothetical protein